MHSRGVADGAPLHNAVVADSFEPQLPFSLTNSRALDLIASSVSLPREAAPAIALSSASVYTSTAFNSPVRRATGFHARSPSATPTTSQPHSTSSPLLCTSAPPEFSLLGVSTEAALSALSATAPVRAPLPVSLASVLDVPISISTPPLPECAVNVTMAVAAAGDTTALAAPSSLPPYAKATDAVLSSHSSASTDTPDARLAALLDRIAASGRPSTTKLNAAAAAASTSSTFGADRFAALMDRIASGGTGMTESTHGVAAASISSSFAVATTSVSVVQPTADTTTRSSLMRATHSPDRQQCDAASPGQRHSPSRMRSLDAPLPGSCSALSFSLCRSLSSDFRILQSRESIPRLISFPRVWLA